MDIQTARQVTDFEQTENHCFLQQPEFFKFWEGVNKALAESVEFEEVVSAYRFGKSLNPVKASAHIMMWRNIKTNISKVLFN